MSDENRNGFMAVEDVCVIMDLVCVLMPVYNIYLCLSNLLYLFNLPGRALYLCLFCS